MSEDSQNIKKTAIEACRALAWMSASYYSVVLSLFYLLLGYAAQGYLARSVSRQSRLSSLGYWRAWFSCLRACSGSGRSPRA